MKELKTYKDLFECLDNYQQYVEKYGVDVVNNQLSKLSITDYFKWIENKQFDDYNYCPITGLNLATRKYSLDNTILAIVLGLKYLMIKFPMQKEFHYDDLKRYCSTYFGKEITNPTNAAKWELIREGKESGFWILNEKLATDFFKNNHQLPKFKWYYGETCKKESTEMTDFSKAQKTVSKWLVKAGTVNKTKFKFQLKYKK